MRILVNLLALAAAGLASADMIGRWQGIATLGPSAVAQGMDGDSLLKLQLSKAFLKTINYTFDFKADKTFASLVTGQDVPRRNGKGTWSATGNMVTIMFAEENGNKRSQTLNGTLSPDGKKMVISINSKPGLPQTKLVFKKFELPVLGTRIAGAGKPADAKKPLTVKKPADTKKPPAAKSTGH
ncbi:MAG: hypothetical protein WCG75_09145 [Armatimonadota bacterium]